MADMSINMWVVSGLMRAHDQLPTLRSRCFVSGWTRHAVAGCNEPAITHVEYEKGSLSGMWYSSG